MKNRLKVVYSYWHYAGVGASKAVRRWLRRKANVIARRADQAEIKAQS